MLLSGCLADGGLATAAWIIALKEQPDGLFIVALQRVLNRYDPLLAGVAFSVIAVITGALCRLNQGIELGSIAKFDCMARWGFRREMRITLG